jgi:hypothetical protein
VLRRLPRDTWILAAVLVLFAALAAARLNPFCLFEPDSPEYLFGSRALAEMRGYLEIDHVGEPSAHVPSARAAAPARPPCLGAALRRDGGQGGG